MRRWSLSLEDRPEVLGIGVGRHDEPWHEYKLNGLWCLHLYRYNGELRLQGERVAIHPGHASLIPPDTLFRHVWPERPSVHLSVNFRLGKGAPGLTAPLIQPLGASFERIWSDLVEATTWLGTEDARISARLWDVMWRLVNAEHPAAMARATNGALDRAVGFIGVRLTEAIDIGQLADEVGVSHNHLTRLFRGHFGLTIQGYIRNQRAHRARHLLMYTTMPIKVVAVQVGIPDLHSFNKTIRRVWGISPSELRRTERKDSEYRAKISS